VTAVCTGGLGPLRGRGASCTPCQLSAGAAGRPAAVIASEARDRDLPGRGRNEGLPAPLWHPERRGRPHERHEQHSLHPALPGSCLSPRAEMKEGNGRSGRSRPGKPFPIHSARCARSVGRPGWILSMLLIPLMRSTPGFWMRPVRPEFPCTRPVPTGCITTAQLSIRRRGAAASRSHPPEGFVSRLVMSCLTTIRRPPGK